MTLGFLRRAPRRLNIYRDVGKQLIALKYGPDAEIAAVWSKLEEMTLGTILANSMAWAAAQTDLQSALPDPWRKK